MAATLNIRCLNDGQTYTYTEGTSLQEMSRQIAPALTGHPVAAKVNNSLRGLANRLFSNSDVEFVDITSPFGMRTYMRTLTFILGKAVNNLYPKLSFSVDAPVSNGYYINLRGDDGTASVDAIRAEMGRIISLDLPFCKVVCPTAEAIAVFEAQGMTSKVKNIRKYLLAAQIGRALCRERV